MLVNASLLEYSTYISKNMQTAFFNFLFALANKISYKEATFYV
ncbi:hypothetical protein ND2E_3697 [Colwellia psychrerythraea]|uniref:Uncharacterized protein n=1 Tax=Colwellia psychrerythraea TaxID=28229 RepID=A0A099KIG6_COLPS|nr:hypothetical protein ND2E_3697 [Colwellia psychrerythraea]